MEIEDQMGDFIIIYFNLNKLDPTKQTLDITRASIKGKINRSSETSFKRISLKDNDESKNLKIGDFLYVTIATYKNASAGYTYESVVFASIGENAANTKENVPKKENKENGKLEDFRVEKTIILDA